MKFNTSDPVQADKAKKRVEWLINQKKLIEIKTVSPRRSLQQNAYLHVTFQIFALETGYSTDESKIIYKRLANSELYVYKNKDLIFLKSSADLTVNQMTESIERWRKYAAEQSVDIPAPNDNEALMYWQNQIEMQGKWL